MAKITRDSLLSLEANHKDRPEIREKAIQERRMRTVHLGEHLTMIFENEFLMRYQIQEMARVERLSTDEEIQAEIDTYNPMIPDAGQLCATLFIELTSEEQMREWLSKLVGIEGSLVFRLAGGREVRSITEAQHAGQLTRDYVTAAVHYVQFAFTPDDIAALAEGGASLTCDHPAYREEISLTLSNEIEFLTDLHP